MNKVRSACEAWIFGQRDAYMNEATARIKINRLLEDAGWKRPVNDGKSALELFAILYRNSISAES